MLVTQDAVRYVCPQRVAFPAPVPAALTINIHVGYVRNADGVDDAMLAAGSYELEVASARIACTLHLAPLYDPRGERVKA